MLKLSMDDLFHDSSPVILVDVRKQIPSFFKCILTTG